MKLKEFFIKEPKKVDYTKPNLKKIIKMFISKLKILGNIHIINSKKTFNGSHKFTQFWSFLHLEQHRFRFVEFLCS